MKILIGLGLVVTGGALVTGAAVAGFVSGILIMQWGLEENEKKDDAEPVEGEPTMPTPETPSPMTSQS